MSGWSAFQGNTLFFLSQFLDWFGKCTESDGKNLSKHDNRVQGEIYCFVFKVTGFFFADIVRNNCEAVYIVKIAINIYRTPIIGETDNRTQRKVWWLPVIKRN